MEIKVSKAVEEARKATFPGGLSQYRTPLSRELEGQSFEFIYDDGSEMSVRFPGRNRIAVTDGGETYHAPCQVQKADDGAYFVLAEIPNSDPRTAYMLVIDVLENLVTCVHAKQGTDKSFPNLVTREVRFGAFPDGEGRLPEHRTGYTKDLIGKKIDWTYNPEFTVMHVYLPENYYTTARNAEMKAKMQARMEEFKKNNPGVELPKRMDPYYEGDCLYIKLRENLYLFSFVEKNSGSGTQGMMIINTDRITDVGCFWGSNRQNEREGYTFSAYGRGVREEIPEDHTVERIHEKEKKD